MSSSAAEPGPPSPHLVCPACRALRQGALQTTALQAHPVGLSCPSCATTFPVVDGIPIVLADVDSWLQSEALPLLCRPDLPAPLFTRIAQAVGGPLWRDLDRARVQQQSPDSPLHSWARQTLSQLDGAMLELGAAHGAHGDHRLIALDLHWQALRQHPGTRVLGDALDPPFLPASFDAVVALNLLDSCRDPGLLLQQADALLRPGGTLVLTSPFHWQASVTSPALWLSPHAVRAWLEQRGYVLQEDRQLLVLHTGPNSRVEHDCLCFVARRSAPAPAR